MLVALLFYFLLQQLKKVVTQKELLIEQVEETICCLDSEVKKTRKVVSTATALTGIAEQLRSKSDEKDAEVRRLTEKFIELRGCITSMIDHEEVSSAFVIANYC